MNTDDMACVGVTDEFFISNHIARNAGNVDDGTAVAGSHIFGAFQKKAKGISAVQHDGDIRQNRHGTQQDKKDFAKAVGVHGQNEEENRDDDHCRGGEDPLPDQGQ